MRKNGVLWNRTRQRQRRTLARLRALMLAASGFSACAAHADCFDDAALYHHVNPVILRAIAVVESQYNPAAVNRNTNGSVDLGEMQINSIHLPELARYGMTPDDLLDGCKSIYTGAWILRQRMDKYGNSWNAIGAYNSATPQFRDRYAARIQQAVRKLLALGYTSP